MKQLIWKELREQAFIAPLCTVLLALIVIYYKVSGASLYTTRYAATEDPHPMQSWALAALLAASVAFSSENGNRTIDFLTALPITRPKIWRAKVLAGLITIAVTVICTSAVWAVMFKMLYGINQTFIAHMLGSDIDQREAEWLRMQPGSTWFNICPLILCIATTLWYYSVALAIAPLIDRTIIGLLAAAVGCYGIPLLINQLLASRYYFFPAVGNFGLYGISGDQLLAITLPYLLAPLFLALSYAIFKRGEILRLTPRLYTEARAFLGWIVTALIAARGAYVLLHL